MQQWEYHILTINLDWNAYDTSPEAEYGLTQGDIARLGNKGWELVGVAPLQRSLQRGETQTVAIEYLFKRPRPVEEKRAATEMTPKASSRIQSTNDRNPESETAKSDFAKRSQRVAASKLSSNGKQ